jgi:hypothetical protein
MGLWLDNLPGALDPSIPNLATYNDGSNESRLSSTGKHLLKVGPEVITYAADGALQRDPSIGRSCGKE